MKTLWIGLGSPLRRDDGVGRRAAEQLAAEGRAARAEIQPVPELALALAGVDRVVFLDADRDAAPGVVRLRRLAPRAPAAGSHALDAAGLLALCAALGGGRAPEAFALSVGAADLGVGEGLSPSVEAALPALLAKARALGERAPEAARHA